MKMDNEYIKIDLVKVVGGLIKRLWLIILAMVIGGSMMFSYASFVVTPMYEARIMMYVNNNQLPAGASGNISSSQITAAKSLVNTYLVILKTRLTLEEVIDRGELDCTYEELNKMIRAEAVNETEVFSVIVTSADPLEAEHIANTIAQVLPDKIASVVEGSSVSIVDYANSPAVKVSPSVGKYTIVGLLGGFLLSCAIIVLIEILDDKIHSESYLLENYENIPLLTVIPDLAGNQSRKGYYYYRQTEEKNQTAKAGKKGAAK